MGPPNIEPLDPVLWFESVEKLRLASLSPCKGDTRCLVRRAFNLIALVPAPLRRWVCLDISQSLFEDLVETSVDTAAMALVNEAWQFELRHVPDTQSVRINLTIANDQEVIDVEAASPAPGIVLAICEACLAFLPKPGLTT